MTIQELAKKNFITLGNICGNSRFKVPARSNVTLKKYFQINIFFFVIGFLSCFKGNLISTPVLTTYCTYLILFFYSLAEYWRTTSFINFDPGGVFWMETKFCFVNACVGSFMYSFFLFFYLVSVEQNLSYMSGWCLRVPWFSVRGWVLCVVQHDRLLRECVVLYNVMNSCTFLFSVERVWVDW